MNTKKIYFLTDILNPELSLEIDAVWSFNSSIFLLPPRKSSVRKASHSVPRWKPWLHVCCSIGLSGSSLSRSRSQELAGTIAHWGGRESEVRLILVSECLCVWEWLDVCSAECCQPLPHSSPPEQIACHHTSITHTPSPDQGDTDSDPTPPPTRAAARFLRARWHARYTCNLFFFSATVQTLSWRAKTRLSQRGGLESVFFFKSTVSDLWLNLRNWFRKYA